MGYLLVLKWIKICLHFFHKKTVVSGLENIPKDKPVLFLPNHQNALIDALVIGVNCNRNPYFLARSDVFNKPILKKIFTHLRMIPVYRIRDGRRSLQNNDAVFNNCAQLLCEKQAVLIFPEANHSLVRKVRLLSKGFTRIIFAALEKDPSLDLQLVPVGVNYVKANNFPDQVAICFGKPIAIQNFNPLENNSKCINSIKESVTTSLQKLTTHINDDESYKAIESILLEENAYFLNPVSVNTRIAELLKFDTLKVIAVNEKAGISFFRFIFNSLNFPVIIAWRNWIKPLTPEEEFIGTFRFVFSLLAYPLYYGLVIFVVGLVWDWSVGLLFVSILVLYNYCFVKLGTKKSIH